MERGLDAPESDRVSHSCFDEFGQRFAWLEHGLKFGAQLWLDADLGYDGGLHARSVLRMGYTHNGLFDCFGLTWVKNSTKQGQGQFQAAAIKRDTSSRLSTTGSVRGSDTGCILAINSPRLSVTSKKNFSRR
jgi:hypothetical protein